MKKSCFNCETDNQDLDYEECVNCGETYCESCIGDHGCEDIEGDDEEDFEDEIDGEEDEGEEE